MYRLFLSGYLGLAWAAKLTYRDCPVFVPDWIALHGAILPRSEPRSKEEASFEQKVTEETKLRFLRYLLFKTCF